MIAVVRQVKGTLEESKGRVSDLAEAFEEERLGKMIDPSALSSRWRVIWISFITWYLGGR